MDLLSPDGIAAFFSQPFFVAYWPLALGTVALCVALFAGFPRALLPLAALAAALQAWQSGLFS
jgi:hypothetical protein